MSLLRYLKKALSPGGHDTVAEAGIFISGDLTGTGSPQTIPHGLGTAPSVVEWSLVGGPAVYVKPEIIGGIHDGTNCYIQCTAGWVYRIRASV